jgi:hypothetical protein
MTRLALSCGTRVPRPRAIRPQASSLAARARALLVLACPAPLDQAHVSLSRTVADIPRPGRHVLVHMLRDRPAARALRHHLGHRPDRDPPARLTLDLGDPHARHPEQRRRRIPGRRGSRAVPDSHKPGSWDPRPRAWRNDTPRKATTRSQSAGRRHPGIGQTFISRAVTNRIPPTVHFEDPHNRLGDIRPKLPARYSDQRHSRATNPSGFRHGWPLTP